MWHFGESSVTSHLRVLVTRILLITHTLEFFTLSHTQPLHDSHLNTAYLIAELQANLARNKSNTWLNKFNLTNLKQSDGFKFDFQIENEVQEIFRTWTEKVVQDFLGSLEERWEWHRMLTTSDFLSLRHIRDQLPQELVDAYDKFQEQVDKYLSLVQARKALEKEEKRVEEEEEQKYPKSTFED